MIRKFRDEDLELLNRWAKDYNWKPFPKEAISPYSYIAEVDGKPVAFSQFYKAEGCGFSALGQTVGDRFADKAVRGECVDKLIDHVLEEAGKVSLYITYASDDHALPIIRRLVERGADLTDEGTGYILYKTFDKSSTAFFHEGH